MSTPTAYMYQCDKCSELAPAIPPPAGPCPADPATPPAESLHNWIKMPAHQPPPPVGSSP